MTMFTSNLSELTVRTTWISSWIWLISNGSRYKRFKHGLFCQRILRKEKGKTPTRPCALVHTSHQRAIHHQDFNFFCQRYILKNWLFRLKLQLFLIKQWSILLFFLVFIFFTKWQIQNETLFCGSLYKLRIFYLKSWK